MRLLLTILLTANLALAQDSSGVSKLGEYWRWNIPLAAQVNGGYMHVPCYGGTIWTFDVANPATIIPVARKVYGDSARSAVRFVQAASDSNMLVIASDRDVLTVRADGGGALWPAGSVEIAGARIVAFDVTSIWCALHDSSLVRIERLDPGTIQIADTVRATGVPLIIKGDILFCRNGQNSILVFRIGQDGPEIVRSINNAGTVNSISIDDSIAWIASTNGLYRFDWTHADTASIVLALSGSADRVKAWHDRIAVTRQRTTTFYDVTELSSPTLLSSADSIVVLTTIGINEILADRDNSGLERHLIDDGDPTPVALFYRRVQRDTQFQVREGYAYGFHGNSALGVYDVSPATNPELVHSVQNFAGGFVGTFGDYLFCHPTCIVTLFDLANPSHPDFLTGESYTSSCDPLGFWADSNSIWYLTRNGSYELGVQGDSIVTLQEHFDLVGTFDGVIVGNETHLYTASSGWPVVTYHKHPLEQVQGDDNINLDVPDLALAGDYLYGIGVTGGITVMSLANRDVPQYVASVDSLRGFSDIEYSHGNLIVSDISDGIRIYGLEDPEHPALRAWYQTDFQVRDLAVAMDTIYALDDLSFTTYLWSPLSGINNLVICACEDSLRLTWARSASAAIYTLWYGFDLELPDEEFAIVATTSDTTATVPIPAGLQGRYFVTSDH